MLIPNIWKEYLKQSFFFLHEKLDKSTTEKHSLKTKEMISQMKNVGKSKLLNI